MTARGNEKTPDVFSAQHPSGLSGKRHRESFRFAGGEASRADPPERTVLFCRDPAAAAFSGCVRGPLVVYRSAVEALLAVAREAPRAVLVSLADVEGREHDFLAAIHKAQPDVPVYLLASPAEEPLARRLVESGASDYVLVPQQLRGLADLLERGVAAATGPEAPAAPPCAARSAREAGLAGPAAQPWPAARGETDADRSRKDRLFEAACGLAALAARAPDELFREGARAIFQAVGATQALAFRVRAESGALEPAEALGVPGEEPEAERAMAERAIRTGETILLAAVGPAEAADDPDRTGTMLCVPVRDEGEALGALCIRRPAESAAGPPRRVSPEADAIRRDEPAGQAGAADLGEADRRALEPLARALARLVRAARLRGP